MATGSVELKASAPERLSISLFGSWVIGSRTPSASEIVQRIGAAGGVRQVAFESKFLEEWDSSLLTFLLAVRNHCLHEGIAVVTGGLPEGARKLLELAVAVPERSQAPREGKREDFLHRLGVGWHALLDGGGAIVEFVGEAMLSLIRFASGRAQYQRSDLWIIVQDCGAQALPIVSLISVLVGLILAFVGAVQLSQFGAQIFVANLVGLGMAREMGAMMTAIIMAGRTGAAFAAQIGTMQVNEEIDALKTLGVSAMDFLVIPRMIALILMMPLLSVYAVVLGIVGGLIVGVGMLDITAVQYLNQTESALKVTDFAIGIAKSAVFGVLIAISGCLRGMQCGRSASAVGDAATSAVVTAIVAIVVADGLFAVITNILGI